MSMRIQNVLSIALCTLLWVGCTKKTPIEEVDPGTPKEPTEEPTGEGKTDSVPLFEKRKVQIAMSEYYSDSSIDQSYFLGSLWHLKDTLNGLQLESLAKKSKPDKFHVLSYSFTVDMGFFEPSYNAVLEHANKFKSSKQTTGISMSRTTFADYAEIQRYLGYSKDVEKVLSLVRHSDSTTVQKKYNTLLHGDLEKLTLYIDQTEYRDTYPESTISQFKQEGYDPYVLALVTYGSRMILMGESDSSRVSLNTTLEKLLADTPLEKNDVAVLESSQILMYYRDGGKDSFIAYPKGGKAIQSEFAELLNRIKRTQNDFSYPLKYSFMSMFDYDVLRTYNIYHTHIRK